MEPRNFQSGAVASAPTAPVTPSYGYASNGNPGTYTLATLPGAFWFHKIGEELRALIVATGATPTDTALNQLLIAINAGCGMSQNLNSAAGWQRLPGGLFMQWKTIAATGGVDFTGNWPMAFPNALFQILCRCDYTAGSGIVATAAVTGTATTYTGRCTNSVSISLIAIGT